MQSTSDFPELDENQTLQGTREFRLRFGEPSDNVAQHSKLIANVYYFARIAWADLIQVAGSFS